VSSIDGRIMLSGTSPDAVTLDKAVTIAKQFAPDIINTVQVTQPQQIMLEVRFIEASRQAGRELGVQWNVFGNRFLANVGNQVPAAQLPVTAPNGSFQQPVLGGAGIGGANVPAQAATMSPIVAAGLLSGASPFGFLNDDVQRGKKYFRSNNFGLAEKSFRSAVEKHPNDAGAWVGLAASYDRLHRFDLADRAYAAALRLVGPTAEILNDQGFSYMLRGDYTRAHKKLEEARAKDPSNPSSRPICNCSKRATATAGLSSRATGHALTEP